MLNEQQYKDLMTELADLSRLRESISDSLARNEDGEQGKLCLFPLTPESVARWMNELGDIEVEIRKKIVKLSPHLPEIKQEPVLKEQPRVGRKSQSKKNY
jgi:hypothetical protein